MSDKLSPAPWDAYQQDTRGGGGQDAHCVLVDANDNVICDTLNSKVRTITKDYDEDGTTYTDEQGGIDRAFCALARNAQVAWKHRNFTVMAAAVGGFVIFDHEICIGINACPFQCILDADGWMQKHVDGETPNV